MESTATSTPDFGRRLAQRQGIEIFGPVGVAARTAATVGDAFRIFEKYMAAYTPAISVTIRPLDRPGRCFLDFRVLVDNLGPIPQSVELSLGIVLGVLRLLIGAEYSPLTVHLPHKALTPAADYRRYFGCTPRFEETKAGLTLEASSLTRPLNDDQLAHQAVIAYLDSITHRDSRIGHAVQTMVRQLLPTGAVTLDFVAGQLNLHPKAMQRRLSAEGASFGTLVDLVRRDAAERYLRDTDMTLPHLTRELGYSEQSVLTRSCRRWFGAGPAEYRRSVR